MSKLPQFAYIPDPLKSGAVIPSDEPCACCGETRGYLCKIPPNTEEGIENLCPWCVADGTAAAIFDPEFTDPIAFEKNNLPLETIRIISTRTPAYTLPLDPDADDQWPVHCEDACVYLGELSTTDSDMIPDEAKEEFRQRYALSDKEFQQLIYHDDPSKNRTALHRFQCRKCGVIRLVQTAPEPVCSAIEALK